MANAMLDAAAMFHDRCDHALRTAREDFERTLAVLREENSTLRRMLEAQAVRADQATTDLIRGLAVQTVPRVNTGAPPVTALRRPTGKDPIAGLGNYLDEVPIGDPNGLFTSAAAASLMAAEDDDGPATAATA